MTSFALLDIDQRYMVDSDGNVYGPKAGPLSASPAVGGKYRMITISGKTHYVHRLVAEMFIPNPEEKPDVAHGDNDGLNNPAWNLRWATEKENMADKLIHGTHTIGERHGRAKLTDLDVWEIRQHKERGSSVDVIAYQYGVSRWTVYDACNPKRRQLADY